MSDTYKCQICGETVELLDQPSHMIANHSNTVPVEKLSNGTFIIVNDNGDTKEVFESYNLCGDTYRVNFTDGSYTHLDKGSLLFIA